jgi:tetratricopeptide (TPR) repeat protein
MDLRDALTVEGMVAMGLGRYAEAVERFGETLAICRPLGLSWQLATSHLNLGTALVLSGSPEEAETALEAGLAMYRQLGDEIFAARMTNGIACAALTRDDIERADSLARIALAAFAEQAERQGVAQGLETLAAVAAARGDAERAATLGGAAAAVRDTIAARAAAFELAVTGRFMERIHEAADEELWHGAWEAGLAMDADAAVAYALA